MSIKWKIYSVPSFASYVNSTAFNLIVIPRSLSRSIESNSWSCISRSATVSVACRIRSANVDFPWSICAIIEKFRMRFCLSFISSKFMNNSLIYYYIKIQIILSNYNNNGKNNSAKYKKIKNPNTSVAVVTKIVDEMAGSRFSFFKSKGTKNPKNAPTIKFIAIAKITIIDKKKF